MKKLMNKKGYVSVETIIVAGLIIALGAFVLSVFSRQANQINSDASGQMNVASTNQANSFTQMSSTAGDLIKDISNTVATGTEGVIDATK